VIHLLLQGAAVGNLTVQRGLKCLGLALKCRTLGLGSRGLLPQRVVGITASRTSVIKSSGTGSGFSRRSARAVFKAQRVRFRSSQASFGNWSKYPTASLAIILQDLLGAPTDQQGPRAVGHFSLDGQLGVTRSGRLTALGRTEDPPSGLVGVACPLFVTIGQLPSPCLGWFDWPESAGASTMAGWLLGYAPRALREYPDAGARRPR
jgi:hypothetical protein